MRRLASLGIRGQLERIHAELEPDHIGSGPSDHYIGRRGNEA